MQELANGATFGGRQMLTLPLVTRRSLRNGACLLVPWLALGAALAGCGPGNLSPRDLTDREKAVRVYQQGEKPDCAYDQLGTVEATSGTAFEMGSYASSVAKMQRDAAALGATGVMVLDHSKNQMADQTTGMAIRCKPAS